MNKFFWLLIFLPSLSFGQKLVRNNIDDFTKASIKETSWERLYRGWHGQVYVRMRKIDSLTLLDLKFCDGTVFSISEGSKLMLKLEDSSVVELDAYKYAITGIGEGSVGLIGSEAMGIDVEYKFPTLYLDTLEKSKVVKFRIYTSEGYLDFDMKKSSGDTYQKLLALVN